MTQTQDEQNVGTPVTPAQDWSATTPVTQDPTQTTSAQPVADNTVNTEESNSNIENKSLIESWKDTVSGIVGTWVEKVKGIWQAGVEWVKSAASQWVESVKDTFEQGKETLKETGQNTIEWIKWIWQDIKEWFWNTFSETTSAKWVLEWGKAIIQWTATTTANVAWNAVTNTMNTWTSVVNGTIWAVWNIASWAGNVVKDSINNVAWTVLPEWAAQWVANFNEKISQWAQNLWTKTKETIHETWQKAKWFFSGLRDNFKSWFSSKDAKKVMDEANAPLDTTQQPVNPGVVQASSQVQQPIAPQVTQPVPQVEQPVIPEVSQASPQVQQPTEVQPGDIQQPTPTNQDN